MPPRLWKAVVDRIPLWFSDNHMSRLSNGTHANPSGSGLQAGGRMLDKSMPTLCLRETCLSGCIPETVLKDGNSGL
eukprot:6783864-Prorocentrum_lima.AAC.1